MLRIITLDCLERTWLCCHLYHIAEPCVSWCQGFNNFERIVNLRPGVEGVQVLYQVIALVLLHSFPCPCIVMDAFVHKYNGLFYIDVFDSEPDRGRDLEK